MGFDKIKIKQVRNMIFLIALLLLGLKYSDAVFDAIILLFKILKPFLIGGGIAFILNIPLRWIEKKTSNKIKRPAAIIFSIFVVLFVITIVIVSVVPQFGKTIVELSSAIPLFVENVLTDVANFSKDYPRFQEYIMQLESIEIDWQSVIDNGIAFLKTGMTNILSSTVTVASSIAGGIMNLFISFIFALYILGQKEKLQSQFTRLLKAYIPDRINQKIFKVSCLLYQNFSNFITGQCLEAVILGMMFILAMSIFRMPYAVMIGVLIAFTALIPIVGAFIGCLVGAFMILVINPVQALWFIVLFLILQQIEGNLIYPRVVGNKVGLPSIWVLAAVSIGGSLFGISGMLFFIPLVSTIYMLLRDGVHEREK